MKKIITAVLAIGIGTASPMACAEWMPVNGAPSIQINDEQFVAKADKRMAFVKIKGEKGEKYGSVVLRTEFDCSDMTTLDTLVTLYDWKGNVVRAQNLYQAPTPTIPGTRGATLVKAVCSMNTGSGGGAADSAQRRSEVSRLDALDDNAKRRSELARLQALMGGGKNATGSSAGSGGRASPGYSDRVRRKVKPNIIFNGAVEGNPAAMVAVRLAPDGSILSKRLAKSSGDSDWDDAVLRAVQRSDPLPRDEDSKAPSFEFTITFWPKD